MNSSSMNGKATFAAIRSRMMMNVADDTSASESHDCRLTRSGSLLEPDQRWSTRFDPDRFTACLPKLVASGRRYLSERSEL